MPRRIDGLTSVGGGPGMISGSSVEPGSVTGNSEDGLAAHITSPAAHSSEDITYRDFFFRYFVEDVEGALDDLSALIPPIPPTVGNAPLMWLGSTISGIPDWGYLKMDVQSNRASYAWPWDSTQTADAVYPYYWSDPQPGRVVSGGAFTVFGVDPVTDPTFNIVDGVGTYTGGGPGATVPGFCTLTPGGVFSTNATWRILPNAGAAALYSVVSGVCFPADRGVLALLHWPSSTFTSISPAASEADVLDRCVGAILLGQGFSGGSGCDGHPGGIFTPGSGTPPSPYVFPGKAAGQFELNEIHTGAARVGGTAPAAPDPLAGQVRLLLDPSAQSFVITGKGIPIFGATSSGHGGGTDGNFLGYRLPYLSDYVNLLYTPLVDKLRFFDDNPLPGHASIALPRAGDYPNFSKDFWGYQIARYRHRFQFTGAISAPLRMDGSYALVHFKTEQAFERYVRDGVAPASTDVWSTSLVDWANISGVDNLATVGGTAASCYHAFRGEVTEDADGAVSPTLDGASVYDLTKSGTWALPTCAVLNSGVAYFLPRNNAWADADARSNALALDTTITVHGLFDSTYVNSDVGIGGLDPTAWYAKTQSPLFLSTASYGSSFIVPTSTTPLPRFQRVEYPVPALYDTVGGTWPSGTYSPVLTSDAYSKDSVYPIGDTSRSPITFTENAKVRVFARKTLLQGTPTPTVNLGDLPRSGADKILYHSVLYTTDILPEYGNFLSGGVPVTTLYNTTKDMAEFFLDESYRYNSKWTTFAGVPVAAAVPLVGPGLPPGTPPIQVPVRPNSARDDWDNASWLAGYCHTHSLSVAALNTEAQVAGLPARDPPIAEGSSAPFPSCGILLYPQYNYSVGYRPNLASEFMAQPNYSGCTGDRQYVRAFNVGVTAVGLKNFKLRLHGLQLNDFVYTGGGSPGSLALAIMVKIPGLTTWMDVGRVDGAGPSKQDPLLDGAGCQVAGLDTFDSPTVFPKYGYVYCQVKINVGPVAAFFLNPAPDNTDCPVLVKVIIKDSVSGKALDFLTGAPESGTTSNCRGIIGMDIVP